MVPYGCSLTSYLSRPQSLPTSYCFPTLTTSFFNPAHFDKHLGPCGVGRGGAEGRGRRGPCRIPPSPGGRLITPGLSLSISHHSPLGPVRARFWLIPRSTAPHMTCSHITLLELVVNSPVAALRRRCCVGAAARHYASFCPLPTAVGGGRRYAISSGRARAPHSLPTHPSSRAGSTKRRRPPHRLGAGP